MINLELLSAYNPWWKERRVPRFRLGKKRDFLKKILTDLDKKQILLITGLRRVGKTTLLYQLIEHLLEKKVNPFHLLYFSFEEEKEELIDILKLYEEEILKEKLSAVPQIFLFLDEIQKLTDWSGKLKRIYDLYPNIKMVSTGSAALNLEKRGRESLAGRAIFSLLEPLAFKEYLDFRAIKFDKQRINLYQSEIKRALASFLPEGGFLEIIGEKKEFLSRYFKELLIERVIFKDIPQTFSLDEPDLAYKLLKIVAENPGILVDYRSLASDLQRDWRTIKNYFDFLEYSLLIRKLYNFSPNLLSSEKKLKKYYPAIASISLALFPQRFTRSDFYGKLAETLLVAQTKSRFFWRKGGKEVDLIWTKEGNDERIIPLEIKYQEKVSLKDTVSLLAFCYRFKVEKALLITKNLQASERIKGVEIKFIPLWLFLLSNQHNHLTI